MERRPLDLVRKFEAEIETESVDPRLWVLAICGLDVLDEMQPIFI